MEYWTLTEEKVLTISLKFPLFTIKRFISSYTCATCGWIGNAPTHKVEIPEAAKAPLHQVESQLDSSGYGWAGCGAWEDGE